MLILVRNVLSWTLALLSLFSVKSVLAMVPPFPAPALGDLHPEVMPGVNAYTARGNFLDDNIKAPTRLSLRNKGPNATHPKINEVADIQAEQIELPLNHSDESAGTFNNSYWVSTKYYKPGGPVFLFDAGEQNGANLVPLLIPGLSSIYTDFLEEFHGLGIVWEQRYYGKSLPPNHSATSPPQSFRYLTISEALADIKYFASRFHREEFPDQDLTPTGTPWVMIGASYAGMRAAFAREKYPETIYAAYVSSAPVQAMIDFSSYYEQVYRAMIAAGREGCARDLHAAMEWIDEQLAHKNTSANVKKMFLGKGAEVNANDDFAASLVAIYSNFQYTGVKDGGSDLDSLCKWMETPPDSPSGKDDKDMPPAEMTGTTVPKSYSTDSGSSDFSIDRSVTTDQNPHSMSNHRRALLSDVSRISLPKSKPTSQTGLGLGRPAKRSAVDSSSLSTPTATAADKESATSTTGNTKVTSAKTTATITGPTTTSRASSGTKAHSKLTTNTSKNSSGTKANSKTTSTRSSNTTPKAPSGTKAQKTATTTTTTLTHTAPSAGWAPKIGRKAVAERLATWPRLVPMVNSFNGMSCNKTVNNNTTSSCNYLQRSPGTANYISWSWQYCSEWGFFQNNNDGPHALLSRYYTVQYQQKECYRAFPGDFLPPSPQVNRTNEETGGWTIRPSNTFWTTSEFDPWRPLSLLSTEDFGPNVTVSRDIPLCNESPSDKVFGYILKGEIHGDDLASDREDARAARLLFRKALKVWLKCWSKRRK